MRLPFVVIFKDLGLFYLYPLILGISAVLISLIRQGLEESKYIDLKPVLKIFLTSVILGSVVFIINL